MINQNDIVPILEDIPLKEVPPLLEHLCMYAYKMFIDLRDNFMQKDKDNAVLDIIDLGVILFPFTCLFVER